MPLFFFFLVLVGVFLCCGVFIGLIFLKRVPGNLCVRSRGNPTLILLFVFLCFSLVWTVLVSQRSTLSFMAHLQAEEPGEPGTDQDVSQGRSRMCSCTTECDLEENDLYRSSVEWW